MIPKHPHGNRRDEVESRAAQQLHVHHHRSHSDRARRQIFGRFAQFRRFAFCKQNGRISFVKLTGLIFVSLTSLYVVLITGLLPIDVAGPLVKRALEEKLGRGHHVEIGETRFVQDASGQPMLSVHGIVIKGPSGDEIARAPQAEILLDSGMLLGNFRAKRIDLVKAVMTIRIDESGRIDISAGSKPKKSRSQPKVGSQEITSPNVDLATPGKAVDTETIVPFVYPELAAWLDRLEKSGLDGISLAEVGLKQGTLDVQNARTGKRWIFANTNFLISRPPEGGVTFSLSSSRGDEEWSLNATISSIQDGSRAIDLVARDVSPEDLMLAAGFTSNEFYVEPRISGILRAQIAQDGRLLAGGLRVTAGRGAVGNSTTEANSRIMIDAAQLQADFNPERRALIISPIAVRSGPNQIALQAVAEAPKERGQVWPVSIFQGQAMLGSDRPNEPALVLDRIAFRGTWDPRTLRLVLEQGDISGSTASLAVSGALSLGGTTPMISLGIATNQLSVSAAKRLWPAPVAPGSRSWIMDHVDQGLIDRLVIAVNMPLDKLGKPDVELPDEAVQIDASIIGGVFRALGDLPPVRDAQVTAMVTGRVARVKIAKAVVETPNSRRFTVSDGLVEVLNHAPPNPKGVIQFRFSGPADAIAETASFEPLRGTLGITFDPNSTKGNVSATGRFDMIFRKELIDEEVDYTVDADVTNFSSDRVVRGQRVDGVTAKVTVTPPQIRVKGEGRLAGSPATFELRKARKTGDGDFRLVATLDENARARAGIDLAPWLTGPVSFKAQGKLSDRGDNRMDVEADLTGAQITDLVPGWSKAPGRTAKATYKLTEREGSVKIEDLNVTGSGAALRGSVELEPDGNIISANFPVFQLSDGDKASLKADRGPDGTLKATVRGDVLDARLMLKRLTEGSVQTGPVQGKQYKPRDLDLEMRIGAASGNNGEVIRQLELRILRRNSEIRSFALLGKIGRDGSLVGELRARDGGKPVLYITSADAGALFRFADYYSRIQGGDTWVMIDPPHPDGSAQEGIVNIRNFSIKGEQGLDKLGMDGGRGAGSGVPFSRLQINFSRTPGKFNIREALIHGDAMGATVSGVLDYSRDHVSLQGNYIPAYGLNNAAGRALFILGTPTNEGLFAYTFQIAGPASGPTLIVNPISGMMPGMFRKLFEFRGAGDVPPVLAPGER